MSIKKSKFNWTKTFTLSTLPCHRSCTLNFMNMLIALQGEVISAWGICFVSMCGCVEIIATNHRNLVIVITSSIVVFIMGRISELHFPIYHQKQQLAHILLVKIATGTCHICSITSTMFGIRDSYLLKHVLQCKL